jgi:hypothetical protein
MFERSSHCSWDDGEMRIVQQYCKKQGGVIFKLFDGEHINYFRTLAEAQAFAEQKRKFG